MEALPFSSCHILHRGVLFNGASLLAQLGSKMVCKWSLCPGSSSLINARMAIIRIPLWVKTDRLKYRLSLNWKIVRMAVAIVSLNLLLKAKYLKLRTLGHFFLDLCSVLEGKCQPPVSLSKMAASSLVASELARGAGGPIWMTGSV